MATLSARADRLLDATVVFSFSRLGYALRRPRLPEVTDSMEGKTVVVTGATSGLGEAAARHLVRLGARVCVVGRDPAKAERTRQRLQSESPSAQVDVELCDLSLMGQIRDLAQRLVQRYPRLQVLVNNAGVLPAQRIETAEGLELCLATNLLGHFLLTNLLIPTLRKSAPARIINVSSGGMYAQKIHPQDLQLSQERYRGSLAYARSKRGQVILTEMWAQQLAGSGVVVHAMHPGWADTPGVEHQLPTFYKLTRPFLRTPEQGADTIVWLAASPDALRGSGSFWLDRVARPTHRLPGTRETEAERHALWDELSRLSGWSGWS